MDGNCKGEFLFEGALVVVVVVVVALWHHGRKEAEMGRFEDNEDMSEDGVGK